MSIVLPGAARAAFCDRFAEGLSPAQATELQQWLIRRTPASQMPLARSIRIVDAVDDRSIEPFVTPGRGSVPPRIHIPRGFRRLQCRLVQLQLYFTLNRMSPDRLPAAIAGCHANRRPMNACLTEATATLADEIEQRWQFTELAAEISANEVEAGFRTVLLHEFAHLALGHFDLRADSDAYARAETDADAYALLGTIVAHGSPYGLFATFSALAVTDRFLRDEGGRHGRFACRAVIANDVRSALEMRAEDAFDWARGDPAAYRERRLMTQGRSVRRLDILGETAGCPRGGSAQIAAAQRDFESILALLDRLSDARTGPTPPQAAVEALLELPLATEIGRTLRSAVVVDRIRAMMRSGAFVPPTRDALAFLSRVLAHESRVMSSSDFGRLTGSAAIMTYELGPPGSVIDEMDAALRPALETAEGYSPDFLQLHLHLGAIAYRSGECRMGRSRFLRFIAQADDEAEARAFVGPIIDLESRQGCAAAREIMRATVRRELGWRD
ncbi:MAG TPA: hypothetical protein VD887_05310 [Allosphingosinicella sp.]|nr:hypothetical protein [Allosphingosinicella sp.]